MGLFFVVIWTFVVSSSGWAQSNPSMPAVQGQSSCIWGPIRNASGSIFTLTSRFLEQEYKNAEGDDNSCNSVSGIFKTKSGPDKRLRFTHAGTDTLKHMHTHHFKSILRMDGLDDRDQATYRGMMVETDEGWFMVKPKPSFRRRSALSSIEASTMGALEDYIRDGTLNPHITVERVDFDNTRMHGRTAGGMELDFDAIDSVKNFTKTQGRTITNASAFLNNRTVRVPPEMYSLLSDPAFVELKKTNNHSAVMDRIYARALEVMGGDTFNALFVSLLITDLRNRGPCGAIYARRGRAIVPDSIFDGEEGSLLQQNRLDAAQHFFGYALMEQLRGGFVSPIVSTVGKAQQYYSPKTANWFKNLHGGTDLESGTDNLLGRGGGSSEGENAWTTPYARKERLKIDLARDKFYNNLGMNFGLSLGLDPKLKPSDILNHSAFDDQKRGLGLGVKADGTWKAYDPDREPPRLIALPPAERIPEDRVPHYPTATDFQNNFEKAFHDLGVVCQNSRQGSTRQQACPEYNRHAQNLTNQLYYRWRRGTIRAQ
ncbi:MAG: hypothetical protein ABL958_20485 [Bdellovibrionia bacterium]